MHITSRTVAFAASGLASVSFASAITYGNTSPFEIVSAHSPDYVLGVQVIIPQAITLQSFGMIYGQSGQPSISNAIFGLYSSDPSSGLPMSLQAVTNPINLSAAQTYDNIAFTSTPNISAGTYWMMALYESFANPRMSTLDGGSQVAYWSNTYANGMPTSAPGISTYNGQNFNYWVNGAPVPEPATLAVLGLGALAVISRRRKR
jgi:hypothetical protein